MAAAIIEFVYGPLAENPHRLGKALHYELTGWHSARRGAYRVIYRIDGEAIEIAVVHLAHRADAYR